MYLMYWIHGLRAAYLLSKLPIASWNSFPFCQAQKKPTKAASLRTKNTSATDMCVQYVEVFWVCTTGALLSTASASLRVRSAVHHTTTVTKMSMDSELPKMNFSILDNTAEKSSFGVMCVWCFLCLSAVTYSKYFLLLTSVERVQVSEASSLRSGLACPFVIWLHFQMWQLSTQQQPTRNDLTS